MNEVGLIIFVKFFWNLVHAISGSALKGTPWSGGILLPAANILFVVICGRYGVPIESPVPTRTGTDIAAKDSFFATSPNLR